MDSVLLLAPLFAVSLLIAFRSLANKPSQFRLSDYFLARGDIGPRQTTANSLNNNFALANILFLFIVWSYYFGPIPALLLEIPWCLSLYAVGRIAPVIMASARKGQTLHGFLGACYQSQTLRIAAALVTSFGYLLNFGFEIYVSADIISGVLAIDERFKWFLAISLGGITATYISIAGFLGNISQDRTQNYFGLLGTLLFLGLCYWTVFYRPSSLQGFELTNFFSADITIPVILGIVAYTSFFNIVDVSNWQGVGANSKIDSEKSIPDQRQSWRNAAIGAWLFASIGVLLGYILRSYAGLNDADMFPLLFDNFVLPELTGSIKTAILGLIIASFFVLALGYAENLLSAAQLTFMADVYKRRAYDDLVSAESDSEELAAKEHAFVESCQKSTFALVGVAFAIFLTVYFSIGEARLLTFMVVIFGSAIGMAPAVIHAVRRHQKGENSPQPRLALAAGLSILAGLLTALSPLMFQTVPEWVWYLGGGDLSDVSSFFAIIVATLVFNILRFLSPGK